MSNSSKIVHLLWRPLINQKKRRRTVWIKIWWKQIAICSTEKCGDNSSVHKKQKISKCCCIDIEIDNSLSKQSRESLAIHINCEWNYFDGSYSRRDWNWETNLEAVERKVTRWTIYCSNINFHSNSLLWVMWGDNRKILFLLKGFVLSNTHDVSLHLTICQQRIWLPLSCSVKLIKRLFYRGHVFIHTC